MLERIDQPRQQSAVYDVFLHLAFQGGQVIAARSDLDHKVRTERSKPFLLVFGEGIPSFTFYPSRIGRKHCPVRKCKARRRIEADAAAVFLGPICKLIRE